MYRRIMVPLDGSKLAECVLPYVEELAKGCGTEEVLLVSVTERIGGQAPIAWPREAWHTEPAELSRPLPPIDAQLAAQPPTSISPKPIGSLPVAVGKMQKQAERYLNRIAKRLQKKGFTVRAAVLLGHPAEEITVFAEEYNVSLIVMASHGRSGLTRWAYGSVADKVFRASPVPVLMVKAARAA